MQPTSKAGTWALPIKDMAAMTGLIFEDFVKVIPNIRSFQAQVNWDKNTTDNGAFDIGTKILVNICISLQPSILADSQISLDIPIKKFRSTNMLKGMQMAV